MPGVACLSEERWLLSIANSHSGKQFPLWGSIVGHLGGSMSRLPASAPPRCKSGRPIDQYGSTKHTFAFPPWRKLGH